MNTQQVLQEVAKERERQDAKWGVQRHNPLTWLAILGEEVGEVNKAVLENIFSRKGLEEYRQELIQVAAVAIAAVESLGDECVEDEGNELTVYKLMVAPKGSSYFQTVVVPRPTGSLLPSEPYPFLSFTEAAKWADKNLDPKFYKYYTEKIKD